MVVLTRMQFIIAICWEKHLKTSEVRAKYNGMCGHHSCWKHIRDPRTGSGIQAQRSEDSSFNQLPEHRHVRLFRAQRQAEACVSYHRCEPCFCIRSFHSALAERSSSTAPTYWCGMGAEGHELREQLLLGGGQSGVPQPWQQSTGRAARASAEQSQGTATPPRGHGVPVIVHELAAFDVWHRDNTAAFVLPIPDGAGNLQHSEDSAIPGQGKKTSVPPPKRARLPDGALSPARRSAASYKSHPGEVTSFLPSLHLFLRTSQSFTQINGGGKEETKSGELKAVFFLPALTGVPLSPANQLSKSDVSSWNSDWFFSRVPSTPHFNVSSEQQQARPGLSWQPLLCSA